MGLREIHRKLGFKSVASVQNYLAKPVDQVDPAVALQAAVAVKSSATDCHRGPLEVKRILRDQGYNPPSETTLGRLFALEGLARKGRNRSAAHLPYWTDLRPTAPRELVQIDTVKVRTPLDGILHELITFRDVVSGATLLLEHNGTQRGMLRSVAYAFAVLGVPRRIQCDNGTTDLSLPHRRVLRPWHQFAFTRGVERIQYIPEAEPQRNGSVESFHNWLQTEWTNHGSAFALRSEDLTPWLNDRIRYYNLVKPLTSLGGKASRRSPADVHGAINLAVDPDQVDLSYDASPAGTVSFIRRVFHSRLAIVRSPATLFLMPSDLEGHYCRFDLHLDGTGNIWTHRPVDLSAAIASGDRVNLGRYIDGDDLLTPGRKVGEFYHDYGSGLITDGMITPEFDSLLGYTPITVDDKAALRHYKKVLKQKAPSLIPDFFRFEDLGDGCWRVYDTAGDLVWTEQSSPSVIDHAREFI